MRVRADKNEKLDWIDSQVTIIFRNKKLLILIRIFYEFSTFKKFTIDT